VYLFARLRPRRVERGLQLTGTTLAIALRTRSNRRPRRSAVTTTSASLTPIGEVGDLFEDAGAVALQLRGASLESLGGGWWT
jgi:hypothetical protein